MATVINASKGSIIAKISENVNKNGKIKGKNKKQTKDLKNACFHHYYNKRGKLKPRIHNNGSGKCTCSMCSHSFTTKLKSKAEITELNDDYMEAIDQTKFIVASAGLGKECEDYLANLAIGVGKFPKMYCKIKHQAEKTESVKKKKNKSGNKNNSYSSAMGGWK